MLYGYGIRASLAHRRGVGGCLSLYNHYHYYYYHRRIIEDVGGHGLADGRPAHFFLSGPAAVPHGVTVRPATPTGCIGDA